MNNDLLAERYHNELEQKYYYDLEKIDREEYDLVIDKYKKLEKKYEDLKAGRDYLIENIKEYVKNNDIGGMAEFLQSEDIKL